MIIRIEFQSTLKSRSELTEFPYLLMQERGAVKEKEFIKKVEEYKAARDGFNSAFQGLAVTEPKVCQHPKTNRKRAISPR